MVTNPEHSVRIPYSHASVPDHVKDLQYDAKNPQAPREGSGEKAASMQRQVIFESGRTPDPLEQLPENYKQPAKELIAALGNPNPALRSAAEQALRRFTVVTKKAGEGADGDLKIPEAYVVVETLEQAAEQTGFPPDEIVTVQDIRARWNLNKSRIQEWKNTGPQGQPRLTPLDVRLKRSGGGAALLLFRAEDIERLVANPPKPGRPWK
jgi:hypothetical protein